MACNDPRYQFLLADAALGKLSPGEMFQLQSHLRSCQTCRESFRAGAILAGKDHEDLTKEFGGHLSNDEITQYYSERAGLAPAVLQSIESHLELCALCREELQLFEQVEQEMLAAATAGQKTAGNDDAWQRAKAIVLHPVFAAAVLLVMATPLYLMWRDQAQLSAPIIPGIPTAIELREPSRSGGSIQTILKRPDGSYLHLILPYPYQVSTRHYFVQLHGAEAMGAESPPVWLRFSQAGKIDALIGAATLPEGRYELTVFDVGREVLPDTLTTSFIFDLKFQD